MKNSLKMLIVALILFFQMSCQKSDTINDLPNAPKTQQYRVNKFSAEQVNSIGIDEKDRSINQKLLSTAKALSEVVKEKEVAQFIGNRAKSNTESNTVSIKEIVLKFPEIKAKIDIVENFDKEECDVEYNGYFYKIAIFCPNAEKANIDKMPIVAAGFDIEDGERSDDCDIILGWQLKEKEENVEINISEKDVINNDTPVFITTLESCGTKGKGLTNPTLKVSNILIPSDNKVATPRVMQSVSSHGYKINHRYDSSNNSEFTAGAYRTTLGTDDKIPLVSGNDDSWWIISNVHKDDIGKDLFAWVHFCPNFTPQVNNWVIFNTYERDWYSSRKTLGCTPAYSNTICAEVKGRMKYDDNWYTYDPSYDIGAVNLLQLNNTWYYRQLFEGSTSKGYLDLWRIGE